MRSLGFVALISSVLSAFALFAGAAGAFAEDALDTSKLPRVSGTKEIFASPSSTIFTAPGAVPEATEGSVAALIAAGWQQYAPASGEPVRTPTMAIANFKKGSVGLSVYVTVAPAQNNATSVTYTLVNIANDLPFPKDATDLKFDGDRPFLSCATAGNLEATSDFLRTELIARGWSPWSVKDNAKSAYADEKTDNGLYAYYVRDAGKPLILVLQKADGGKTSVKLETVPPEVLHPAEKKEVAKAPEVSPAPAAKPEDKIGDAIDDLAASIVKQAQQSVADSMRGDKPASRDKADKAADEPTEALTVLDGNTAPIPVPSTATDIEFDGASGKLEFTSSSSVKQIAAFYRSQMKALGWTEEKSVINQANMVALGFHKGEQDVSLTLMKMGATVNVTANGSALEKPEVTAEASANSDAATAPANEPEKELESEDAGGLPVPKEHSLSGSEQSMFRHGANANAPAKLTSVLAFYRRELGKRDWKEDASKSVIKDDAAELHFTTADGPAVLKLGRASGETTIALTVREDDKAKKSGLLAKPGQTKFLFGNYLDTEAVITIAGKTIKVPAGAGSKGPDGPTLDVQPGKYPYKLKGGAGGGAPDEPIEVGANEIWGVMIGPGGVLSLQMY
ncbi:hypothetical protein [Hyphomicrobium sp.]|uniref:hypothetical protein n=1 Tax=Hyphomicrobium sp. TaxID=82 RepID=UPI000FC369F5|nr:hypothetical protein [Hyphomicrobium sp.]RUP10979.1 MAG: hypothetical protein EKK38_00530 [Hyphomicrobium sp.]